MVDTMTAEQRHRCMSHIRSRDTRPETMVRHYLFSRGFRYRKNVRALPGTPDIVLGRYRTVIFVNGCFWHGHEGCRYFRLPKTNAGFWQQKIERNQARDARDRMELRRMGWHVIQVWECQLKPRERAARYVAQHRADALWHLSRRQCSGANRHFPCRRGRNSV